MPEGGNWKDLLKAAGEGDVEKARYHIAAGVDPNFQHAEYFTAPIFEAIRNRHLELVKILVDEGGANPALIEELTDDTTIEVALASRSFDILDYLNTKVPLDQRHESRRVLVTEGISGTGKELVSGLLLKGHSVFFLTEKSEDEANAAKKILCKTIGNPKLEFIVGDLDSIYKVRQVADMVRRDGPSLNTVIHNACLWPTKRILNDDGLEVSFMINYLARHILNSELMPLLEQNGPSRIVYVAPEIGEYTKPDLSDTPYGKDFHWRNTFLKTLACGSASFWNAAQEVRDKSVTITMVKFGRPHHAIRKSSANCCTGCLLGFAKYVWPDTENEVDAAVWLAEANQVKAFHGKMFSSKQEEISSTATMPLPKEWEQWTRDFLSRSDIR
eukprot:scaffold2499_cov125-Cylindrotheca_fusiformis.AAC.26